jgi:hypothetical protein
MVRHLFIGDDLPYSSSMSCFARIPWILADSCHKTPSWTRSTHSLCLPACVHAHVAQRKNYRQINHKSTMATYHDTESRGTMIFAWWMACISDAYASAYYRRKPVLDDDDYDIDFYTVGPTTPQENQGDSASTTTAPSTREQLEVR